MKKSEAVKMAQKAVLDSDLPISTKKEVIEVLLWEEYIQKIAEVHKPKEEDNGV